MDGPNGTYGGSADIAEYIRKFVVVAEELHFGRAAERLGMAQPPLSRAVQRLERRLGVELFDRRNRQIELTPAGEVLLAEGRKALTSLQAAKLRAKRAGRVEPRLVLVMKPGGDADLLDAILTRYAEHPDAVEVEVMICGIGEQEVMLREGEADVALLRRPYDDLAGFATEELLTEREVAVVRRDHRLATRTSVTMADLAGETFPRWTPDSEGPGPLIRDTGQVTQLIALGKTIAVLPESVKAHLRRDLVAVPILDGQLTTLLIAWSEESRSRPLAALIRTAAEVAGQTSATVEATG
jgi:DNA-binding transcriptional LysR family regulator